MIIGTLRAALRIVALIACSIAPPITFMFDGVAFTVGVQAQQLTGIDWDGTGDERRMLYWDDPFPIYPATYLFKVYPRDQVEGVGDGTRYFTTFFWGNNGNFHWDSVPAPLFDVNTYYGAHPYPTPPREGDGKWEISVYGADPVTRDNGSSPAVSWGTWHNQAFVAWRESTAITHHKFYIALPSVATSNTITYSPNDVRWADDDPPSPAIVMGQAPNVGGLSWGGYSRWEEANEIIRGIQFYDELLTQQQILDRAVCETDSCVLALCAGDPPCPWFLNMNPTPSDVTDKSGNGNHPAWDGSARPTLWVLGTTRPNAPTNLTAN